MIMIYSDRVPLAEPVVIPDIFASGLARIEDIGGGNLRFTFYTTQRSTLFVDERPEHVIVERLVMPLGAVQQAIQAALIAIEGVQGVVNDIVLDTARH
jgi:hypothetical protein